MNLAQELLRPVTPLKNWTLPKDQKVIVERKSDAVRKLKYKQKVEIVFNSITRPMNAKEICDNLATQGHIFVIDTMRNWLLELFEEGRLKRSSKQPYVYWKL